MFMLITTVALYVEGGPANRACFNVSWVFLLILLKNFQYCLTQVRHSSIDQELKAQKLLLVVFIHLTLVALTMYY